MTKSLAKIILLLSLLLMGLSGCSSMSSVRPCFLPKADAETTTQNVSLMESIENVLVGFEAIF